MADAAARQSTADHSENGSLDGNTWITDGFAKYLSAYGSAYQKSFLTAFAKTAKIIKPALKMSLELQCTQSLTALRPAAKTET